MISVRYFVFLPLLANPCAVAVRLASGSRTFYPDFIFESESLQINQILQILRREQALSNVYSCLVLCLCYFRSWPSVDLAPLSHLQSLPTL